MHEIVIGVKSCYGIPYTIHVM